MMQRDVATKSRTSSENTTSCIKPPRLCAGSRIGLVCPADSGERIPPQQWKQAENTLQAKGYQLIPGQYVHTRWGHTSGSIDCRVQDLMGMFQNPAIDGIMAVLGGFNSHQLLPYLDFEFIHSHPKVLVGFSDMTALVNGIFAKTGLVTFIGPMFGTFSQPDLPAYTEECFRMVVAKGQEEVIIHASELWADESQGSNDRARKWRKNTGWVVHKPGVVEGSVLGGDLSTLLLLAGTEYMPNMTNGILFVEGDKTQTPATIDRGFTQLRHLGVFQKIRGLVVGRFPSSVEFTPTDSLHMILEEATRGYDFPIVSGVDFSHTDPLITIPIGIQAELNTQLKTIRYLERAVI